MTRLQIVFGFPHCCICEQRTCSPRSAFSSVTISILETSGKWNMVTDRPKSFFQHCVSTSMAETISLLYYDTLTCWLIVFWLCHSMKTNNLIITVVLPKISATKCNEFPYLWNSYFKDGNKISDHNQLPSSVSVYASSYPSSWYSKSLEKKAHIYTYWTFQVLYFILRVTLSQDDDQIAKRCLYTSLLQLTTYTQGSAWTT